MFIAGLAVTPALREAQAVKGEANEHISEQESAQASYPWEHLIEGQLSLQNKLRRRLAEGNFIFLTPMQSI